MPETLPECGHCGSTACFDEYVPGRGYHVSCADCGASSGYYLFRVQALAAWTRRRSRMPDGSVYVIDPIGEGLVNAYVIPKESKDG